MTADLNLYCSTAQAIALLLAPHAEVVIHDEKTRCIAAIFNPLSKRKVGDESLLDEADWTGTQNDVIPPYLKTNWNGRTMKSVSAVLRNRAGKGIGLLCINLDISQWEKMHQFLQDWIGSQIEPPDFLFKNDWRERINFYVTNYIKDAGCNLENLDKEKKRKLVLALREEGAFETKNAATYVADVLQISRATVYNYLKDKTS